VTAAPVSVLDAEAAYVGALLHLPAEAALDALGFTAAEDFVDRRLSIVAAVCRDLAARGVPPNPTAVLTHIRAEAIVAGADALRSLALLLADLYIAVPIPGVGRALRGRGVGRGAAASVRGAGRPHRPGRRA
jgi:hypothetical protein